jgi:hypothetical protein
MIRDALYLPCGGEAHFDDGAGYGHRCEMCGAVLGSIGQPRRCREEADKWTAYEKAGMWRWDYTKGESVNIKNEKQHA